MVVVYIASDRFSADRTIFLYFHFSLLVMDDYSEKFRFLFLPVLAVTLCFICGYVFFYWLYFIYLEEAYLPTNLVQLLMVVPSSVLIFFFFSESD